MRFSRAFHAQDACTYCIQALLFSFFTNHDSFFFFFYKHYFFSFFTKQSNYSKTFANCGVDLYTSNTFNDAISCLKMRIDLYTRSTYT